MFYVPFNSAPASPIWRGGLPLLPFPAAPLPFLSCLLSYFNFRHKTLHFGENFMKIRSKLKMLSMFKGHCYVYSIFDLVIVEWDYILFHVLILSTSHDTWCPHSCITAPYMVPLCPQILAGALLSALYKSSKQFILSKAIFALDPSNSVMKRIFMYLSHALRKCALGHMQNRKAPTQHTCSYLEQFDWPRAI